MDRKRCVVIVDSFSEETVTEIRNEQQNTGTINERRGEVTAFGKALAGSKIFLKAQGYLNNEVSEE